MSRGVLAAAVLGLAVTIGFVVAGCQATPMQRAIEGRGVTVDKLFEHDGVIVYRFYDGGYAHYYAVDGGHARATFSTWSENCGKDCTRTVVEDVATVAAR